jgi:hypothetical protein
VADSPARKRTVQLRQEGFDELWVDERLGDWVAQYRIVPQDGVPVVAEIRVLPWSPTTAPGGAFWVGYCPPGGLPALVLRQVTAKAPLDRRDWQRTVRRYPFLKAWDRIDPTRAAPRTVTPAFLAGIAAAYLQCCTEAPQSPMRALATRLNYSLRYAKHLVDQARDRGYLTSLGRGRAGGTLSAEAKALLEGPAQKGTSE